LPLLLGDCHELLTGAVALIRDFITQVIHKINVLCLPCSLTLATFQVAWPYFAIIRIHLCSVIAGISLLLFISFSRPTSLRVFKLLFRRWSRSQNRATSPSFMGLNLEIFCVWCRVQTWGPHRLLLDIPMKHRSLDQFPLSFRVVFLVDKILKWLISHLACYICFQSDVWSQIWTSHILWRHRKYWHFRLLNAEKASHDLLSPHYFQMCQLNHW
jgi:hypothetical protein